MKAVVLSAGYGTRLGALTRDVPKPMLPVAERPLLEHLLVHLARCGFGDVAVNLHFQPNAVRDHFGDGSALGIRIHYSYEPELLGTAGTLASLHGYLGEEPFLVHYGDVLTGHDLGALRESHLRRRALCSVLVHERPGSNSVVVVGEHDAITEFVERPGPDHPARRQSSWTFSGISVCDAAVLDLVPPAPADFARDVLPQLAGRPGVYAVPLAGPRVAVDSPDRYRQAEQVAAQLGSPRGI